MSTLSSSAAASSNLSRSKGAVLVVSALICALGAYSLWRVINEDEEVARSSATSLHRSNAVHRRRRQTATGTLHDGRTNPSADLPIYIDDPVTDENAGETVARALTDGETVVDEQGFQDEYEWRNVPQTYERNGQNIVQLLFRVSEDATRRNAYVHRGCECNSCGAVPIRGIRYHCANCADYDLCEGCESQGLHTKTHIFYKIRVPAPSFGPILSMPVAYSGDPESVTRVLPKEITIKLSRETGFERPELDAYWEQWTFMANTDWRDDPDGINLAMDRTTFEHCLVPSGGYRQAAPSLIFDRMFAFYDTNNDNLIGFSEFLHGIAYRKKKDKWSKIFQGYDIDGDGFVDRKDFLRMFRSYYVLYRQMHRDMLGGMQEQHMISSEARRLVNGRQPLSSAFGNDGRYPRAPDVRAGEGKSVRNGNLEINDGKGVLNESGNDTAKREELFTRTPADSQGWSERMDSEPYWEAMMNPPTSVEQMPSLARLERAIEGAQELLDRSRGTLSGHPSLSTSRNAEDDAENGDESDSESISILHSDNWLPNFCTVTDADAEAVQGPGTRVVDLEKSNRRAAIVHAVARERTQQQILDRWKRRQFYTDEEEGGSPPSEWKEEDDILAQITTNGESSKANSRPSFHSRSSSKVRFAEDMDDYDTRSNPSTSSRSVPERWGGMELPDAEKDAGKEILFQVTQQSFNELLDPIFKDQEDAAVAAAEQKDDIEKWRSLFTTPEFETWAKEKESSEDIKPKKNADAPKVYLSRSTWPSFAEVEVEEIRERPLEDLLAVTGYTVDSLATNAIANVIEVSQNIDVPQDGDQNTQEHNDSWQDPGNRQLVTNPHAPAPLAADQAPTSPLEVAVTASQSINNGPSVLSPQSGSGDSRSREIELYRDPTMPQFRPNAVIGSSTPPPIGTGFRTLPTKSTSEDVNATKPDTPIATTKEQDSVPSDLAGNEKSQIQPNNEALYILWKADKASKEAEERGGWGRLSFEEFETKIKRFVKEGKGNQMDYLGSWIEFCIP